MFGTGGQLWVETPRVPRGCRPEWKPERCKPEWVQRGCRPTAGLAWVWLAWVWLAIETHGSDDFIFLIFSNGFCSGGFDFF
jgi:hypothetical protein